MPTDRATAPENSTLSWRSGELRTNWHNLCGVLRRTRIFVGQRIVILEDCDEAPRLPEIHDGDCGGRGGVCRPGGFVHCPNGKPPRNNCHFFLERGRQKSASRGPHL